MRNFFPLAAGVSLALLAPGAQAQSVRSFAINFNDVAPGTAVNTFYTGTTGATFSLVNSPIFGQVIADNPGLPPNPDPASNALSGVDGPIRYSDSQGFFVQSFTFDVVVDPAGFGQSAATVSFLGINNATLATLTIDQAVGGTYTYTAANNARAVAVVLPGDAFYDNLRVTVATTAPEPGTLGLAFVSMAAIGTVRRRRK